MNINFKEVEEGFSYSSDSNESFLTVNEIRELIATNIDKEFKPF